MNLAELEKKIESLEQKVKTLDDIEQINTIQRAYGYYLDNLMPDEIANLFADDGTLGLGERVLVGKESIRNYWTRGLFKKPEDGTKKLYVHLQLQGVVHVNQGGQTANGRWQMLGLTTDYLGKPPGELQPIISHGVYENEYIRENGVWKIKSLRYTGSFTCTLQDGWVKATSVERTYAYLRAKADKTLEIGDRSWRSGYKVPCHFKNPVSGR